MPYPHPKDAPELFATVMRNAVGLFRAETALIRAELAHSLSRARTGLALVVAALVSVLVAAQQLATALAGWLATLGLPEPLAALFAAVTFGLIALALAAAARPRLDPDHLKPRRSLQSLRKDTHAIREAPHVK